MDPAPLQYERLVDDALRSVMVRALEYAAENGLFGEHHFYVTYRTDHPGVVMSDALRARYPEEITIVLQHQFWDLVVGEESFSVGLSFNQMPETLVVPFAAVTAFVDPSVKFGLQFQNAETGDEEEHPGGALPAPAAAEDSVAQGGEGERGDEVAEADSGAKVVALDKFRKK